jgi:hypothetical protein
MKEEYNSRQRKIYSDYIGYQTDRLLEMFKKSDDYNTAVIEIIKDILIERNALFPASESVEMKYEKEIFSDEARGKSDEQVKVYVDKLEDEPDSYILDVIIKYSSYKPDTVRAALFVSVERGLISYSLKELLLKQIETNLATHIKPRGNYYWESNNAFLQYVSRYTEEEIYTFIDDPDGIVIDVYHAILLTAKERELISEDEFSNYFEESKGAMRSDEEIMDEEIKELIKDFGPDKGSLSDRGMVSGKDFNYAGPGFSLIGVGVLTALMGMPAFSFFSHHTHYGRYLFGALFALFGIFILIYGLFSKNEKGD